MLYRIGIRLLRLNVYATALAIPPVTFMNRTLGSSAIRGVAFLITLHLMASVAFSSTPPKRKHRRTTVAKGATAATPRSASALRGASFQKTRPVASVKRVAAVAG